MPWLEKAPLDQGLPFLLDDQRGRYERTERCARYSMSHKTGNQWLTRVDAEGREWLRDRRRSPMTHNPNHRWAADCNGQFPTQDGSHGVPRTIADH